jgi:hypothetical protein
VATDVPFFVPTRILLQWPDWPARQQAPDLREGLLRTRYLVASGGDVLEFVLRGGDRADGGGDILAASPIAALAVKSM